MNIVRLVAEAEDECKRIDSFLSVKQNNFTRSGLEKLFPLGKILVNGEAKNKNYRLEVGDEIELVYEDKSEIDVKPKSLTLEILYEDESLLVVNKAKGMIVHPSSRGEDETLVNALLYHCGGKLSTIGGALRPGIVHRIDKDTSGLLVVAKTNRAHEKLAEQAAVHTMLRRYEGIVHGILKADEGVIALPIGRHPVYRTRNCVTENGRDAVTRYRVLRRYNGYAHAEFELETGRMHQIRVHMAHIGAPIAGDPVYGQPVKSLNGQCLHAGTLGFIHPETGERLEFFSELPEYFTGFISKLEPA